MNNARFTDEIELLKKVAENSRKNRKNKQKNKQEK